MAKIPRTRETAIEDAISRLEHRIRQLEDAAPVTYSFVDETTGVERMRVGLQDDDTTGIRIWNASGGLVHDATFA